MFEIQTKRLVEALRVAKRFRHPEAARRAHAGTVEIAAQQPNKLVLRSCMHNDIAVAVTMPMARGELVFEHRTKRIVVDADALQPVLESCGSSQVKLELREDPAPRDSTLDVAANGWRFEFQPQVLEAYEQSLPGPAPSADHHYLPVDTLTAMCNDVLYAAPKDDPTRPHIEAVQLRFKPTGRVELVALDGHRAAFTVRRVKGRRWKNETLFLLNKHLLRAVLACKPHEKVELRRSARDKRVIEIKFVSYAWAGAVPHPRPLVVRVLWRECEKGMLPNVHDLEEKTDPVIVPVDMAWLAGAAKRVKSTDTGKIRRILRLAGVDGKLVAAANIIDGEVSYREDLDTDSPTPDFMFGANPRYLIEAERSIVGPTRIEWRDPHQPLWLRETRPDDAYHVHTVHVLMPMRTEWGDLVPKEKE